ncbi:unnamed protein product [Periconia digitata]|uniref:HECT-type E3 ubiquitin transferase n=1 Tax=Periconia digitata TaxID=1303443 RepID=A0A9W4XG30_9PLEO|nr:unnamed protein product [Periconia digitata]
MFTSFSGNTRRPRQVNLGGRKTHAFGSAGPGAGSQAALDRAQQDRAQRQRERESLKAAKTIQRVWRGHRSRKELADKLRSDWDKLEGTQNQTPFASEEEAYGQLLRLVQFASTHNHEDADRIWKFTSRQMQTIRKSGPLVGGAWPSAYLKLEGVVLAIIERQTALFALESIKKSLGILRFIAEQIPVETSRNAQRYYTVLARVASQVDFMDESGENKALVDHLSETVIIPLKNMSSHVLNAYEVFGYSFLPLPVLAVDGDSPFAAKFRDSLADAINYKLLANALATSLTDGGLKERRELAETGDRLRFLGLFIYLHRFAHNFHSPEAYSVHKDFVAVISLLLNSLPTNLIEGSMRDDIDQEQPINDFLRDQILSLVNQEGIANLLSASSQSSETTDDEKVDEARQLANYALALLRFFPQRGDEIRMWLYIGPSTSRSKKLPAIKYFWEAAKRTSVFAKISRNSRVVIDLLRPKAGDTHESSGFEWQAPQQQLDQEAVTAHEWRVILVFLELYTFILKVTDDEEFFAGSRDISGEARDNSLPLPDVKELATFLKNFGFTMYYNAADINEPEQRDSSSTSLSFFAPKASEPVPQKPAELSVGGVAGLSLDYVKGLVTGLVRSIYERDSRRKFLPADQWLMSRFHMDEKFIDMIVTEEESRHKIQEEDAEDVDDVEEEEFDDTPHIIGTGQAQRHRSVESRQRQLRKQSRRRFLQAVAPRLEIVQNMPFFIPFTTRVQIFRKFVHLDMVSCPPLLTFYNMN